METKFYSVQEIAKMFSLSIFTVYRWIKDGKIRTLKVGRHVRISQKDLDNFIQYKNIKGGDLK